MSKRICLIVFIVPVLSVCARYEYVNELDVPGLCPSEEERRISRERAPELQLESVASATADSVRGRVVVSDESGRELTNHPVPYGQVQIVGSGQIALIDSLGRFVVPSPLPGRYLLRVQSLGYVTRADTLRVPLPAKSGIIIALRQAHLDGECSGFAAVPVGKPWWKWW